MGAPFKPYFGLSGIPRLSTVHSPLATSLDVSMVFNTLYTLGAEPCGIPFKPKYGLNGAPVLR